MSPPFARIPVKASSTTGRAFRGLGLAALVAVLGCGRATPPPSVEPGADRLTIDLTPRPDDRALEVEVRVPHAQAGGVEVLAMARSWADHRGPEALRDLEVSDGIGGIVTHATAVGPDVELRLARKPEGGPLRIRYRVVAAAADASLLALRVGSDRVSGVGHTFLVLPRIDGPLPTVVRWHNAALGASARGASSFGTGDVVSFDSAPAALAHAVYAAGPLEAVEGSAGARLARIGGPAEPRGGAGAIDPAAVLAWTTRTLGAARRLFLGPSGGAAPGPDERLSMILVPWSRLGDRHEGAYLHPSLVVAYDADRDFDAGMRVLVAHEIVHRWIGETVALDDADGRDADWFSEGFTVHYARTLLLREGLLSPSEFLEDLHRTTDASLARIAGVEPHAVPRRAGAAAATLDRHRRSREGYDRGALYAAKLDADLADRGKVARSLDELLLELVGRARLTGEVRLPVAAFRDLVVRELGPADGEEFDRLITRREAPVVPPSHAFGPCFARAPDKVLVYELGFDRLSLGRSPAAVRGLVRGSAAERAGLREGALLLDAQVPPPAADGGPPSPRDPVVLKVAAGRAVKVVTYKPAARRSALHWAPRPCASPRRR